MLKTPSQNSADLLNIVIVAALQITKKSFETFLLRQRGHLHSLSLYIKLVGVNFLQEFTMSRLSRLCDKQTNNIA